MNTTNQMRLAPVDPTPEMIDAADSVNWCDGDARGSVTNMWHRMLAAAPEHCEVERWMRIAEHAEAVITGGDDKGDYFEVPSHLIAALALALDEAQRASRPGKCAPERAEPADPRTPPPGCRLLGDYEPAQAGDMAYIGAIAGRWRKVRPRMGIIGATMDELSDGARVLALARPDGCTDRVSAEEGRNGELL